MNEPHRLLEQGATEAERALLDSARADGPPEGAAQRMLFAVEGLSAGSGGAPPWGAGHELGSPLPSASVAAQSMKLGALAKVGLVALVGAGALGGGVLVQRMVAQRSVRGETAGAHVPVAQEKNGPGTSESPAQGEAPLPPATSEAKASAKGEPETRRRRCRTPAGR